MLVSYHNSHLLTKEILFPTCFQIRLQPHPNVNNPPS